MKYKTMSCIVLVGGIIGCGKSTLIKYFLENRQYILNVLGMKKYGTSGGNSLQNDVLNRQEFFKIILDDLCSISEQAELMKTLKGWRTFRSDLLMASEYFISHCNGSECRFVGPLTKHSQNLLNMLEKMNDSSGTNINGIFLVEDNLYYRSMRHDWLQIAKRANIGFCEVFLQCPLATAIHRNSTRGYCIPEQKIKAMLASMEYPEPERYKWEKYSILFDSSSDLTCSALTDMIDIIERAVNNPAEIMVNEDKIEAQKICSKNAVHQADILLRKIVSKKICHLKVTIENKEDLKLAISMVVDIRQEILDQIREGFADISRDLLDRLQTVGIETIKSEFEECLNQLFEDAWTNNAWCLNLRCKN